MTARDHDDYPKAARKHLHDATALQAAKRYDGAAYLAGYVVECTVKALIRLETGMAPRTHDLEDLRQLLEAQAGIADVRTTRLGAGLSALADVRILAWQPQMRYRAPEVREDQAATWVAEAQAIYSVVIGGLVLDGLL